MVVAAMSTENKNWNLFPSIFATFNRNMIGHGRLKQSADLLLTQQTSVLIPLFRLQNAKSSFLDIDWD